jgi:hypothetical protein
MPVISATVCLKQEDVKTRAAYQDPVSKSKKLMARHGGTQLKSQLFRRQRF